jgi:DNA polymerase-1
MTKKLFLLDALALVFRAYYALIRIPRLTSKGRNTNAQFGFTNTLIELLNNQKPSHMAVCFDTFAPTVRDIDFSDYKANRQESPEDILAALPDIKKILEGFCIPVIEAEGYEADDLIGTLSIKAAAAGFDVYMVTPDKDFGQLVTDNVFIYKPGYQGGDAEVLTAKEVCEKWNIKDVSQVKDLLGLMGDSVDNIPGIPGVGEKTAAKLLAEYDTLENILANADNIKGALGEKVRKGKESALMSKKLATIITDVPVEFHEENFRIKECNKNALREIFTELEFKALGRRVFGEDIPTAVPKGVIDKVMPESTQPDLFSNIPEPVVAKEEEQEEVTGVILASQNIQNTAHDYKAIQGDDAIRELVTNLNEETEICINTESTSTDANDCELVGLSFSVKPNEGWYVPFPVSDQEETKRLLEIFQPLFENPFITWVGQNLKNDMLVLKWYEYELRGNIFDTMLAHYVIDSDAKKGIDMLSAQYLGYETISVEEIAGKGRTQTNMKDVPLEKIKDYEAEDADVTLRLKHAFTPLLQAKEVEQVFIEVENPLVRVLADMEFEGIRVDTGFLNEYSKELDKEAKLSEERVYEQAGVRFNLSSPRQLGEVLFEKLKLDPKAKKTKTGQYATGEDVLLKLSQSSEIVNDILTYRELTKLKSTYVDALPLMINKKTGRVHTNFAQAVAVTGRLSSINPNLQNIPIRTERGREIRKAFIPRDKDHIILSADYSQIELRIVAAISGDPAMIEAFQQKRDIHNATAAKVYGIDESAVTKVQRYKAKSVNFGIIYGQGAFGLADNLGISRAEAKEIIENYKKQFASIQKYMDTTINFAKEHGYVKTLMGRKRWLKDINSANFTVRSFAERNAINSPIQGSAADMIKMAMIKIHQEFKSRKIKSKMLLQVHDELVFDALREEAEEIKPLIIECMRTALPLPNDVPVEAEIGGGETWLEAH